MTHDLPTIRSFRTPTPELLTHARMLEAMVDALLKGDQARAKTFLEQSDSAYATQWIEDHWGPGSFARARARALPGQPGRVSAASHETKAAPSTALKREIVARDGFHCRLCGMPLIRDTVRKAIAASFPDHTVWGNTNATQHGALQCFWYQFDHALPYTRGGETVADNLVATCAGCNYGRMEKTFAEVAIIDPRTVEDRPRAPGFESWNGLEYLLGAHAWS